MRDLLFTVLFLSLPIWADAQIGKDTDSIYMNQYQQEIYTQNFLVHNLSSPLNFGDVSLSYRNSSGNRRLAQQANATQNVDFYAIGANQLWAFRISGDFLFNKVFEDSLAYGQRNDIDEWSTFNYYASKAGIYERQNYKANMTLSYKIRSFIQPFFNINYLNHWTTGSVDPRFESKKFEMKYNPGLIVNLGESNLGVKAILGKGRENLNISYKSREYRDNLLHPERVYYLNLGYGLNSIKDTSNTRKYSDIVGAGLSLHTTFGRTVLDVNATIERKNEDNTNDLKSTSVYRKRGTYQQDTYLLKAILQIQRNRLHHLIQLNVKHISGQDGLINFSSTFDKVNYTVNYLEAGASYLRSTIKRASWNYDAGFDLNYYSIERKDYATFLSVSNAYMRITPKINVRKEFSNQDVVQLSFQPSLILDVAHDLSYSTNTLNSYIQGVVFWDYDYYRTNAMDLNWTAKWITSRVSKQYLFGVQTGVSLERSLGSGPENRVSTLPIRGKRTQFSVGVFLNL